MEKIFFRSVLIATILSSMLACSKVQFSAGTATTSTDTTGATTTTTTDTTTTSTTTDTTNGACATTSTVTLSVPSAAVLSDYAGQYLASPSAVTTSVHLHNTGDGHYYGDIQISYLNAGIPHNGVFSAPPGNNVSIDSLYDNGTLTSNFNHWYNGGANFSGFFQDTYGALVLSISSVDANGCASGNLYYKNFIITAATNIQSPYRECWFIYAGPYACRASTVINKTSLVPGDGYNWLGSFSGLPVGQAFQ